MHNTFQTASDAFHDLYWRIIRDGVDFAGTKALFNVGFEIQCPKANAILDGKVKRNWSYAYAEAEWKWYLSGDRNIKKLGELYGKVPQIWKRMADQNGNVNSNYGWQWKRNNQLEMVIETLRQNPKTRQAAISIYDGKEITDYAFDTLTAEIDKYDGSSNYIRTGGASSLGGDTYTNSDVIPRGCTIYGRWTTVDAKAGDKCICYFG